ncbi:malate dehydrogenase, partial [bacterium]
MKIKVDTLKGFVKDVFVKLGVPEEDAGITADVLVASDRRGIPSHGVARLKRYVDGIKKGIMKPKAEIKIIKETPTTLLVSGGDGLGQPVSYRTMKLVIEKAKKNNVAFAAVRNSNHYGIAGYYAMMALKENLIGISMTNSAPLVVPTHGKDAVIGTNPISIAVPAGEEKPFVLDMATSTVPRGKLEVYNRRGKKIPLVWATDENGIPTDDPGRVLENLLERKGGGLLPLGGAEEETGGHKGYGLSVAVDILSGVLSGGAYGPLLYGKKGEPPNVCHFFGAINIEAFIPLDEFKKLMDDYIRILKGSTLAKGKTRIWIHGEKEFEAEEKYREEVEIEEKVVETMREIGKELGVEVP